jgi:hypothetical protein
VESRQAGKLPWPTRIEMNEAGSEIERLSPLSN